jgi:hypothetical protein
MDALLWAMLTNLPHKHNILISNTSPYVNGLNVTSSSWIALTPPSTCRTISPNLYNHYFSTDTLTSYLVISPQVTHLSTPLLSAHTPITPSMSTNFFLNLTLHHVQLPLLEFMHPTGTIINTARGYAFLGMQIQSSVPMILSFCLVSLIILSTLDCGGVLP